MDEFLYIIAGIAWLAFSIYQQSQKKKQQAAKRLAAEKEEALDQEVYQQAVNDIYTEEPEERVKEKSDFKKTLEEILLGEKITLETIPQEEAQSLETIPEKEAQSLEDLEEVSPAWSDMKNRSPESLAKMKDDLEKDMVLQEDSEEEESIKHYFNLRDAVIYAEILKPKYVN